MKSKKIRKNVVTKNLSGMSDSNKIAIPNTNDNVDLNRTTTDVDHGYKYIVENDYLNILSLEILCNILNCLRLRDFLKLDHLSRKLHDAVTMHLRTLKSLDFNNREVISWINGLSDQSFINLCKRCNDVQFIYGFHPTITSKRRHRGKSGLSIPGIIDALTTLPRLKGIEVSDTMILETIFSYFPNIEVIGTFRNRNGCFPVVDVNSLLVPENPLITSLHLFGIVVPRLPPMVLLKDLQLHHVHFTNTHPFTDFAVPSLKCFVMANCAGPADFLRYVPLIAGLAAARSLKRLELIRVPFLGGLLHHVIGESLRVQRFKNLRTLKFGACKHVIVMDAGFLAIASAENLEEMFLQPSLSKDSLFIALKMSFARFPAFNRLCLGYTEPFQESGNWTNQDLAIMGLAYIVETPAPITDNGMKSVGECFMTLKFLEIYNCPHLCRPTSWLSPAANAWDSLRELVLRKCHALKLDDFCDLIPSLPSLEAVHLEQMFREPPKGCSRVGISTGSGFGLSSSLIPGDQLGGGIGQSDQPANHSDDGDSSSSDSGGDENIGGEGQHPPEVDQPFDPLISDQEPQLPQSDSQSSQQTCQPSLTSSQNSDLSRQSSPNGSDLVSQCASKNSDPIGEGTLQKIDSVSQMSSQSINPVEQDTLQNSDDGSQCTYQNIDVSSLMPTEDNVASSKTGGKTYFHQDLSTSDGHLESSSSGVKPEESSDTEEIKLLPCPISQSENGHPLSNTSQTVSKCKSGREPYTQYQNSESRNISNRNESCFSDDMVTSDESRNNCVPCSLVYDNDDALLISAESSNPTCSCNEQSNPNNASEVNSCSDSNSYNQNCTFERYNINDNSISHRQNISICEIYPKDEFKCKNCDSMHQNKSKDSSDHTIIVDNSNVMSSSSISNEERRKEVGVSHCSCDIEPPLRNKKRYIVPQNSISENKTSTCSIEDDNKCTGNDFLNSHSHSEPVLASDVRGSGLGSSSGSDAVLIETSSTSNNSSDRVGKSLYGKKKGLVKRDINSDKENKINEQFKKESTGKTEKCNQVKSGNMISDSCVELGHYNNSCQFEKSSIKENFVSVTEIDEETGKEIMLFTDKPPLEYKETNLESESDSDNCPMTRSRAREMAASHKRKQNQSPVIKRKKRKKIKKIVDLVVMADKWCQVDASGLRHHKGDQEKCKCGTSGYLKVMTRHKKHPVMLSKGTSTSDPVMEEDYSQVLILKSRSLQCITLNMVGVTDIQVEECPQLTKISANGCRVLKNVKVSSAADSVSKVQLTQCKKLISATLIDGIRKLESKKSRVIILRPMQEFDAKELERSLFSSSCVDYGVCIVYDYSPDPSYTTYNRTRLQSWIDLISGMNSELLKNYGFKEHTAKQRTDSYPWGRSIYTITGYNTNSSRWELITDIPWLRPLYESPDLDPENKIKCFDDKKDGVYCPGAKGHESFNDCIWECLPNIVDELSVETHLFRHSLFVYINLCDISGSANFDPYA